ncbi:MAG: pyruvate, phosphate dikinase [Deltaproteobacteria bacterium CG12_big_fil_rev_8_21_14_0_65_43_10]|nr:MAG: pyruvate, phosphate dikinase [Deltaproteobacteria bacterium CG2_30_43_15]PIQ46081.1 MAG: pyruvate, phosphate dikinase [Deltaproteobacteria bacterium CG12_big_fil_rev_8_21_14_0_65_43_10]PIX25060.1 MAG: pyruvate, phosphate dikinase [Deltaproteobacteria bacterium CG_4_8_14_3_um_filter_43_13]PIZ20795.1 MAG: pyruvate, phosphate dikinase [Deltaproteobacteria bacterium CG_4_10_14_0_8_um_filter_43_12]
MKKYVYFFGSGKTEGNAKMKELLGGKGCNLAEMANLGIPVPPGFTITTEVCTAYYDNNGNYPEGLKAQVEDNLTRIETAMGAKFGDEDNPLLVSVRSGARVSMPGMMDTVLNLGLNDMTVKGLIKQSNDERFAYDCYRRFVQMYGDVVLGLKPVEKYERDPFEVILEAKKEKKGVTFDNELNHVDLKELVAEFKLEIKKRLGVDFPEDPMEQLWGAIGAVFGSWNNERAIAYRELNNIPRHWGTAVNVQTMVFGNMGDDSGTGVAFTRDPSTGTNIFYGEYLMNAQGEDVVAGIRTPKPINKIQKGDSPLPSLEEELPDIYGQLVGIRDKLEKHYRDLQDIEFTIQKGKLWMLQTRSGKRTGFAALRIAVEMVREGLIKKEEAIMRIEPEQLNQLLNPVFDLEEKRNAIKGGRLLARGLNAGPGAACGKVVFNAAEAEELAKKGDKDIILVRIETSPEDIRGMNAAKGILTARGGMTSHAALVARQMGKVCVAGCGALEIDYTAQKMKVGNNTIKKGDYISIDGTLGEVILGKIPTTPSETLQVLIDKTLKPEDSQTHQIYAEIMSWADEIRALRIRTNADKPDQVSTAISLGAEGIGLCRTEHMFFEGDRIDSVREMILSDDRAGREKALGKLLPMQREDFASIFRLMNGMPVTIRTLDPPLHEFLPGNPKDVNILAKKMGISKKKLTSRIESLHETNPMLGHRGCRLGIVYPEITEMQARAIFEAACQVAKEGIKVFPEVMIPLVGHVKELIMQKEVVDRVAKEVIVAYGIELDYLVGTMIELPRAAITADEIAQVAEFFSFGTNDLTQMTFGLSRDDAGKFLPSYIKEGILETDPFQQLDQGGVGKLVEIGVQKGRGEKPSLKVGICGEHGGDPSSIEFCHRTGLNYVSCSPYRIPIARLAAAQAVLRGKESEVRSQKSE